MSPPQCFNYPHMTPIPTDVLTNLPQRRIICCCTAKTWTKAIGWFQVTMLSIQVLLFTIEGVEWGSLSTCNSQDYDFHSATMCTVVSLVRVGIGIMMGIVLIVGASNENPCLLKTWIIYVVVSTVLFVMMVLESIEKTQGDLQELTFIFTSFVITMAIKIFSVWMVHTFRKEIKIPVPNNPDTCGPPPPYSLFQI